MEEPTSDRYGLYLLSLIAFSLAFAPAVLAVPTAPPYELIAFENAHYRAYTRAELEAAVGSDASLLGDAICDGRREHALFTEARITNPRRDSFRIRASRDGEVFIYREGQYYHADGSATSLPALSFFDAAVETLRKLERHPTSRALLRELEQSRFPLTLEPGAWMRFNPSEDGKNGSGIQMATAVMIFHRLRKTSEPVAFHQLGVGGEIIWDPNSRVERIEADGKKRRVPPQISLAHELYHAYDSVRGALDTRLVWGPGEYESTQVLEYRAVYFENLVRAESGLRYAKYYSATEGPDLLDAQGQPLRMPAPCLSERVLD
jgi:hypothetical protein